ncbi:MAG: cysteine synthase family protein [Bacteroidota bacterium]
MIDTVSPSAGTLLKELDTTGKQIGNTRLYPLTSFWPKVGVKIYAKLEWEQLGQSVKARAAYYIIRHAVLTGKLGQGKRLLDATSGNTGIAYASIASRLGIPLTIVMPENASPERKTMLKALGAELIYTSPLESTDGSQRKARKLSEARPDLYYYADQYNNENNWKAHYQGTANEIYKQTEGTITHFIAGLGTTGTFTGTSRRLRELIPSVTTVALQPETAMHGLEGWKDLETAKVPGIYDASIHDEVRHIASEDAYDFVKKAARQEGLLLSPSSAANLAGAVQYAASLEQGVIVTVFPDDFSKYQEVYKVLFP